ncbi:MAG TPA: hypothetical protein QGH10_21225, partial [Armatimonadota bacterium]|nr:hypothetical protein [Armatimonadota bacterium]
VGDALGEVADDLTVRLGDGHEEVLIPGTATASRLNPLLHAFGIDDRDDRRTGRCRVGSSAYAGASIAS